MPSRFPPDAILLAAGLGTRMLPLTTTVPKPLLRIGHRSLLERVVDNARAEGVRRFAVNAHHHLSQVEDAVEQLAAAHAECGFSLSPEPDRLLDTGGGARQALALTSSDPVLVMNTDAFWLPGDRPLARMEAARERREGAVVLLCVHPVRARGFRRSHDFCLDPSGMVTPDRGAPVIYAGVALLSRAELAGAEGEAFSMNLVFERALAEGRLSGVALDSSWFHVGDPAALAETEAALAGEEAHAKA